MAVPTILQSDIMVELILPFILVFTVIFAILQKTEILGKDKRQIDALVALAIGLITVAYANVTGIIVSLMPFLAVSAVVILVFLILWGFSFVGDDKFKVPNGVKIAFGILAALGTLIAVLYVTPAWGYVLNVIYGDESSALLSNVIVIVIIVGAVAAVIWKKKGS